MIIYCIRELEWVIIVCDVDKSMICTDKFLKESDVHMEGYILLGRGKILIVSDSDYICTRNLVWNVSVWRHTRFVPFIFSLHDQLLQYFYQFLKENIKFNSFWFPSTWWFPFIFYFFKYWPEKKMPAETLYFWGVFIMARI